MAGHQDFGEIREVSDRFQGLDFMGRVYTSSGSMSHQAATASTPSTQHGQYGTDDETSTYMADQHEYWSDEMSQTTSYRSGSVFESQRGRRDSIATRTSTAPSLGQGRGAYGPVDFAEVGEAVLFCVFAPYADCDALFHAADEHGWIEHHMDFHLGYQLPQKLFCWFCDTSQFRAGGKGDVNANFRDLMEHVRHHIVFDRMTLYNLRVDHYFVEHLRQLGLVEGHIGDWAMDYSEGTQVVGIHELGYQSTEQQRAAERKNRQEHDLAKEDRTLRRKSKKRSTNH